MKRLSKAVQFCSIFAVLGLFCYVFAGTAQGERVTPAKGDRMGVQTDVLGATADSPYSKLAYGGAVLPNDAKHLDEDGTWIMTRDNVTGLIWEVKQSLEGLRYYGNTYSWHDANPRTNGGHHGFSNRGECTGSVCDTGSYIESLNAQKFGGFNDWRMPTVRELASIVDARTYNPSINTLWFPNTVSNGYWSSTTYVLDMTLAWIVPFYHGLVNHYGSKSGAFHVRAVRTGERPEVAYMRE